MVMRVSSSSDWLNLRLDEGDGRIQTPRSRRLNTRQLPANILSRYRNGTARYAYLSIASYTRTNTKNMVDKQERRLARQRGAGSVQLH